MVKIGNVELHGRLTLAPMAGVTDFAFRRVCRELGAALTTTEMVSAKALVYKDEKTKALLYIPEGEGPCAVQIFGHEPEIMAAQLCLPITVWINLCDREPEREAEIMEQVSRHIQQFFKVYQPEKR